MTTRICLIRHGETDWNVEHRMQGQADAPLNATGRQQAQALAAAAAHDHFAAIYSSDMQRAADTAAALAQGRGLQPQLTPQLRERHFGKFQGLLGSEAAERYPEDYARYKARELDFDFGNGESLRDFAARVEAALRDIAQRHPEQTVAVVSHAGVLDVIYRKATGRPLHTARDFAVPNCALNWFSYDGVWQLEAWGESVGMAGREAVE